jgi:hypothetical protein
MLSFALLTVTLFAAALAAEKRAVVPSQPGLPGAFRRCVALFFFFFASSKKKKKKKKNKKPFCSPNAFSLSLKICYSSLCFIVA